MTITVEQGEDLLDVAIRAYGSFEGVFFLLEDNPELAGITAEPAVGTVLIVDGNKKVAKTPPSQAGVIKANPVLYIVTTAGQNIFDIAIQEYGGIEGIFDLMQDNPTEISNLNSAISAGTLLKINRDNAVNKSVLKHFSNKKIRINTGDDQDLEGVGYWIISEDNIVT